MVDLALDLSDFERKAKELRAYVDQVPFALANAMTTAAFRTREFLIDETWPGAVQVRNRSFMRRALLVKKRATKRDLSVEIWDDLGRANLKLHATGGTSKPKKAARFAIPPAGSVHRTSQGVRKSDLPKAIIARTPKRALRITPKGIFVGKGGRLRLRYVFTGQAQIDKDVPFIEDFARVMRDEINRAFPRTLELAMRSRKPR